MPAEAINEVAERLRGLRESCDASAEELAAAIGVSVETYNGYEDGSADIPISALYKVVSVLNVDLTELLTGKSPKLDTYCVVRAGQGISVDRFPGYEFKSVAFNFLNRMMEPLIVHLEFGADDPGKKLVTHTGQEFNYVIEGSVKLTLGERDVILNRGDCCYFNPMIPHGQSAVGGNADFLTVIIERI
ncbi:MAG: XRE family transcriptional regulator [Oscillospiraceae bacterium]|nr:XRE family transcriptional regulator [Oscillospiraceae bacterium]